MQLGFLFERPRAFFGATKYLGDYAVADVALSPEVQKALELSKTVWSATSSVPLVSLDEGNHGLDRGLIMRQGILKEDKGEIDFTRSELVARVSFGAGNYDEKRTRQNANLLDFSKLGRLHISLHAARQFFPENWEALPIGDRFEKDNRELTPVLEEVHVSLRWIDGKYDDWSNIEFWVGDINNRGLRRRTLDEERTIYCSAVTRTISESGSSGAAPEKILKFLEKEGRRKQVIPLNPSVHPYGEYHHVANQAVERLFGRGIHGRFLPIVGYDSARRVIQSLPYNSGLDKLTPMQGVEFLFQEVLPPLKNFVERKIKE